MMTVPLCGHNHCVHQEVFTEGCMLVSDQYGLDEVVHTD